MRKDRYIYPAIFHVADDGISVEFPDLPGCLTCGDTIEEAFKNAKEAMGLYLYESEKEEDQISEPTQSSKTKTEQNEALVMVEIWMPFIRDTLDNRTVTTNSTISKWLERMASESNVNYPQLFKKL